MPTSLECKNSCSRKFIAMELIFEFKNLGRGYICEDRLSHTGYYNVSSSIQEEELRSPGHHKYFLSPLIQDWNVLSARSHSPVPNCRLRNISFWEAQKFNGESQFTIFWKGVSCVRVSGTWSKNNESGTVPQMWISMSFHTFLTHPECCHVVSNRFQGVRDGLSHVPSLSKSKGTKVTVFHFPKLEWKDFWSARPSKPFHWFCA